MLFAIDNESYAMTSKVLSNEFSGEIKFSLTLNELYEKSTENR